MYDYKRSREENAARIVALVAETCSFPLDRLYIATRTGNRRKPEGSGGARSEVQRIACAILRERNYTLCEIAEALGLRDHTSVMHHLSVHMSRVERDLLKDVRRTIDRATNTPSVAGTPYTPRPYTYTSYADRMVALAYGQGR